jgi:hypothetical protein
MQTSESIKNIATALVQFHDEVGKISKDAINPFFKSTYCSLPNILDAINAPLVKNGLSIVQSPEGENGLTTRLMHISGEWMESNYIMKPVKDTPQDRGSVITYQRRYAIGAILSLNIDDDDDANKATHGSSAPQQAAQPTDKIEKPWLNKWADKDHTKETPEWGKVLKAMVDGVEGKFYAISDVKKRYKLSKELEEELKAFEKKS